ncbi:MAG: hypothetical protein NTX99_06865, partial [Candidatus Aminicenantes bacterium]|nr:hypothetical protein [Candidatus Aminicenantes bacterium]
MPDTALLALTWRITRRKIVSSPLALAAGLALPVFVVWIGLTDSYGTAARFFFFLLPHVFLIAAQDAVRTDIDTGALENVLFLGGRFRGFLAAKGIVLAAAAAGYAAALFGADLQTRTARSRMLKALHENCASIVVTRGARGVVRYFQGPPGKEELGSEVFSAPK